MASEGLLSALEWAVSTGVPRSPSDGRGATSFSGLLEWPERKTCHRGKIPNASKASSHWPNKPCLSEAGGTRISVGRAAMCLSHGEACKRILKMSSKSRGKDRSLSHSLLSFPSLPSEVRPGSLESERNAHCHSQIHGTKPGWEPRQKPHGQRRLRRAYSSLYKLPSAPLEGSQPTSSPGKKGGKWLLRA